jgi:hypothetical protein
LVGSQTLSCGHLHKIVLLYFFCTSLVFLPVFLLQSLFLLPIYFPCFPPSLFIDFNVVSCFPLQSCWTFWYIIYNISLQLFSAQYQYMKLSGIKQTNSNFCIISGGECLL